MDLNASIIDQQVQALANKKQSEFASRFGISNDRPKLLSATFVLLCVKTALDLTEEEAFDCLTEGGSDFGIDAIEIADIIDGEFTVNLFQGKYKSDLEGTSNFPENGVTKALQAVRLVFDPDAEITVNKNLLIKLEEVRSLIRDGNIPRVRFLLCNNGKIWSTQAQELIDHEKFDDKVKIEHFNHDSLIRLLQSSKPIQATLKFSGKAIVEDFDYIRVVVGKVAVTEIASLLDQHGDRLLERNIRRYLGLSGNRVNKGIQETLTSPEECPKFYFYNNGVTLTCSKFDYNALQDRDYRVRVDGLQIINGGQTCKTIEQTLTSLKSDQRNLDKAFVLVRLYQLPEQADDWSQNITYATNSQNPVDLRDLRSNDQIQKDLELSVKELGYQYRRQRSEVSAKSTDITSATAAEAVLSIWRKSPHQAKFRSRELFGKLYDKIFKDLNGSQLVIAVLLYRIAEAKRRAAGTEAPDFIPYSSYYISMLMGDYLLQDLKISLKELNHRAFSEANKLIESKGETYYKDAVERIKTGLEAMYEKQSINLQKLSAVFRRADLIESLDLHAITKALLSGKTKNNK